jgi:hypothetical protein
MVSARDPISLLRERQDRTDRYTKRSRMEATERGRRERQKLLGTFRRNVGDQIIVYLISPRGGTREMDVDFVRFITTIHKIDAEGRIFMEEAAVPGNPSVKFSRQEVFREHDKSSAPKMKFSGGETDLIFSTNGIDHNLQYKAYRLVVYTNEQNFDLEASLRSIRFSIDKSIGIFESIKAMLENAENSEQLTVTANTESTVKTEMETWYNAVCDPETLSGGYLEALDIDPKTVYSTQSLAKSRRTALVKYHSDKWSSKNLTKAQKEEYTQSFHDINRVVEQIKRGCTLKKWVPP